MTGESYMPRRKHRLKTLRNGIGNAIHCNGIDTVSRKYDVMYIL